MRQDQRFHSGEALTSVSFARQVSSTFDGLVTVDPPLHRYRALDEIYSIPSRVVHSAPAIAEWISKNERSAILIGPDIESEQWVSAVAGQDRSPYRVLRKERFGDRNVKIEAPDLAEFRGHTPVLIDDIVSSGRSMTETARQLRQRGLAAPCASQCTRSSHHKPSGICFRSPRGSSRRTRSRIAPTESTFL